MMGPTKSIIKELAAASARWGVHEVLQFLWTTSFIRRIEDPTKILHTPFQLVAAMYQITGFPEAHLNWKTIWGHYYTKTRFLKMLIIPNFITIIVIKTNNALILLMLRKVGYM